MNIPIVTKTKNENIQFLRGIAILAVVIIHSSMPDVLRVVIRPFVNYAVALFIFLSGYLTNIDISDKKNFMKKRIIKVIVPYMIWSIIFSVPSKFEHFGLNLLTGRCCGIYYYIFVYVQFVILTPLISRLIKSQYAWIGWLITPISTLIFRYIFKYMGLTILSTNFNYFFFAWFIYYYMGLYMGNDIFKPIKKEYMYWLLYLFSIILSITEGFIWYKAGDFDLATTQLRLTSIITSSIFITICYFYIRNGNTQNAISKFFVCVGNYSFGIYLSHILIISIFKRTIGNANIFPINAIIVLLVTAGLCYCGKKILKKYSWIFGL